MIPYRDALSTVHASAPQYKRWKHRLLCSLVFRKHAVIINELSIDGVERINGWFCTRCGFTRIFTSSITRSCASVTPGAFMFFNSMKESLTLTNCMYSTFADAFFMLEHHEDDDDLIGPMR